MSDGEWRGTSEIRRPYSGERVAIVAYANVRDAIRVGTNERKVPVAPQLRESVLRGEGVTRSLSVSPRSQSNFKDT